MLQISDITHLQHDMELSLFNNPHSELDLDS